MEKYTHELIENVNNNLQNIYLEENDIFIKASQAVNLLENVFGSLKSYISNYSFKNENEEISFFKEVKPQLFSNSIRLNDCFCKHFLSKKTYLYTCLLEINPYFCDAIK